MKCTTTLLAALATMLLATGELTTAGGGHHRGHGHHGHHGHHHSGFHFSIGHGLHHYGHHYYGHRRYYPSYSYSYPRYYSYSYPSYRSYSYYPSSSCSSVIYSRPAQSSYSPQQVPAEQYEKPKVEPIPPAVPAASEPTTNPAARSLAPQGSYLASFGASDSRDPVTPSVTTVQRAERVDDLGPQFTSSQSRRIVSDDETPWVVGDSTLAQPKLNGNLAFKD